MNIFSGNESLFRVVFRRLATTMRRRNKNSSIQSLYELCKETFTLTPAAASSQAIQKLSSLMDSIQPVDVGFKDQNPGDDGGHGSFRQSHIQGEAPTVQPITFLDIYECESFVICIFCFPTLTAVPLHDHRGTTILSKVLYGSLRVKAYDWVEPSRVNGSQGSDKIPHLARKLAKLVMDEVVTAQSGASVLYPKSGGNVHSLTAITPCAVLEILFPPLQDHTGRRSAYYSDYPYSSSPASNQMVEIEGKHEYAWLAEINTPDGFYIRRGRYAGPSIRV